jgi:hypothetical protein
MKAKELHRGEHLYDAVLSGMPKGPEFLVWLDEVKLVDLYQLSDRIGGQGTPDWIAMAYQAFAAGYTAGLEQAEVQAVEDGLG